MQVEQHRRDSFLGFPFHMSPVGCRESDEKSPHIIRWRRITSVMLAIGWLLFVTSLFLPSITLTQLGEDSTAQPATGLAVFAATFFYFWVPPAGTFFCLTNLTIVLSPFLWWNDTSPRTGRIAASVLGLSALVSFPIACSCFSPIGPGCILYCLSLFFTATGFLIPVDPATPGRRLLV